MAGGGVASMYDPLYTLQYSPRELLAAVDAAQDYGTYLATHVYTVAGIHRAVDAGVKSIEHGHLADEPTIALLAERDVWLSTQPFAEHDHNFPTRTTPRRTGRSVVGRTACTSGPGSTVSRRRGGQICCSNPNWRASRARC